MTQEEFQSIVLSELKGLKEGQVKLEEGQVKLENRMLKVEEGQNDLVAGQNELKDRVVKVEEVQNDLVAGQKEMRKDIKAIIDQTAILTEFREEANLKLDKLNDKFSSVEIITSQNWNDLARIKASR